MEISDRGPGVLKATSIHQGRGLRFPSNDSMDEVNIGLYKITKIVRTL